MDTAIRRMALAALLVFAIPTTGLGQDCFRGRPLPECRTFWFVEAGYDRSLTSGTRMDSFPFSWHLGPMWNVSTRAALGGGFLVGGDDTGVRVAMFGRFRYWATHDIGVDVGGGLFIAGSDERFSTMMLEAGVSLADWVGLFTRLEYDPGRARTDLHAGVQLSSTLGILGSAVLGLAYVVSVFSY